MLLKSILAAGLFGQALAATTPSGNLDYFISIEKQRALQGVIANIGPNGALSQKAKPGVVIAAPSTVRDQLVNYT